MDNEYGYANARLRAMKSRLLTRNAYAELLNEPSVEDVVAYLSQTVYQSVIETALVKASGWDCMSEGLRRHFSQTLDKIDLFFGGAAQQLWRILVSRWQVFNIKTILRGLAHQVPASEILDALIPAGDLEESDFRRLAQQTNVRAAVDLLATWNHPFARTLLAEMPRYAERGDLAELELALDRARYKTALKALAEMDDENADLVRSTLAAEIDATNLLSIIRLSAAGLSGSRLAQRYGIGAPQAVLIDGGGPVSQHLAAYREMPTLEQLVRDLHATSFGEALARAEARYNEKHSLAAFEDEIENQLTHARLALFQGNPLSVGIAIAYLTALVTEVRNLRVIGRAKAADWKREEIEKELRLWPS